MPPLDEKGENHAGCLLLKLPGHIRKRIYIHAGLINLYNAFELSAAHNQFAWSHTTKEFRKPQFYCETFIPNQLFFVSRAISEDARYVFYSRHLMVVMNVEGLRALNRLGPLALHAIKEVIVHVAFTRHRPKINETKPAFLAEWEKACSRLGTYGRPYRLCLDFKLSAIDQAGPEPSLYNPMFASFPKLPILKRFSICISGKAKLDILIMVATTTHKVMGWAKDFSPFRFNDLPPELQLKVLEHADLVVPRPISKTIGNEFCLVDRPYRLTNEFSSDGTSWTFPYALLLANRAISYQAQYLFFMRNHFKIDGFSYNMSGLSSFPKPFIRYLRKVELDFGDRYEQRDVEKLLRTEWRETVQLLKQHATLNQLSLKVTMLRPFFFAGNLDNQNLFLSRAVKIVEKMKDLQGLKFLQVDMRWPQEWPSAVEHERMLERMVMGQDYTRTREF